MIENYIVIVSIVVLSIVILDNDFKWHDDYRYET